MQIEKERRIVKDRRQRTTRPISQYTFCGRRQSIRRQADRKRHLYVDRYGHKVLLALLLILLLSVVDAYFTIFHLERGAREINPFMNLLIRHGYMYFFIFKYLLTALATFILCIYKNLLAVRIGIRTILLIYLAVFAHHLFWAFRM